MYKPQKYRVSLRPRGATLLEALVALTLLTTIMSVSVQFIVRHARVLSSERDYRLALDELSNQLERITALPHNEVAAALEKLQPSEFAATQLHGAKLTANLEPADLGQRLTVHITWDEPQRATAPLSLSTWIFPRPRFAASQLLEGETP